MGRLRQGPIIPEGSWNLAGAPGGVRWYTDAGMSHGMGGPCLLLTLVLFWTVSALPAVGGIGLPARTGITGAHEDAQARSGLLLPAADGIFSLLPFSITPVLVVLAPVAVLTQTDVPAAAIPSFPTRGPPLR